MNPVEVMGIPSPDQLVRIDKGQQFLVPPSKVLVITGVASRQATAGSFQILVDGTNALGGYWDPISGNIDSTVYFWGYQVEAGSIVEITAASQSWIILGYLADA